MHTVTHHFVDFKDYKEIQSFYAQLVTMAPTAKVAVLRLVKTTNAKGERIQTGVFRVDRGEVTHLYLWTFTEPKFIQPHLVDLSQEVQEDDSESDCIS